MSVTTNDIAIVLKGQHLTPGEQIALLKMLRSDLAQQVLGALAHSTARSGYADFVSLRDKDYARQKPNGYHVLTEVKGTLIANRVARHLAKELGIPIPTNRIPSRQDYLPGMRPDGRYGRLTKTTFNPW